MKLYKKILSLTCAVFSILPALCAPAFAVDDEYFNVYPYLFHGDRSESFEVLHDGGSTNYDTSNLRNLGVYTVFDYNNISGTYIVNMSFSMASIGWSTNPIVDLSSVRPYKLYLNYTDKNTYDYVVTFNYDSNSYSRPSDDFDFYYTKKASSSNGSTLKNFVDHNINFIIKDTFHLSNIYIEFTTNIDLKAINYSSYGPTFIKFDSTSEDLVNSLGSLSSINSQGFQDVVSSVVGSSASSTSELVSALSDVQKAVQEAQQSIKDFENNIEDHTKNALEQYFEDEEKKVVEAGNAAVDNIVGQLPLLDKKDSIMNVFSLIMTSISDSSTDCKLKFPAGSVSVSGTSYTFWDEQTIDFNSAFSSPVVSLLLMPLRFLFAFGLFKYSIFWIRKIISTIIME